MLSRAMALLLGLFACGVSSEVMHAAEWASFPLKSETQKRLGMTGAGRRDADGLASGVFSAQFGLCVHGH